MLKNRLLIIGIDGADLGILTNLIKLNRDVMPTINALIQEGIYGRLRSTIPPCTIPAWTSSVTGVDVDKHGLYDFFLSVDLDERKVEYADRTKRKYEAIWNLLGKHNLKTIVVNVPVTYPPEPINGVMVSGMLTPSLKSNFTYPSSIKEELIELGYSIDIGDFMDHVTALKYDPAKYIERLKKLIALRTRAVEYLMREFSDWDCLFVVFTEIDRLQHWFMDQLVKSGSFFDLLLSVYNEVDNAIARFISLSGRRNVNVIIYSDHGFRYVRRITFLNNILRKYDLLKIVFSSRNVYTLLPTQEWILRRVPRPLLFRLSTLIPSSLKRKIGFKIPVSREFHEVVEVADPSTTKAFLFGSFIHLSKALEEKEKREIINKIRAIKKIVTGYKVLILHKSEVYRSPWAIHIPEFPVLEIQDVVCSSLVPNDSSLVLMKRSEDISIPSLLRSGAHSLYGIVILYGPMLRGAKGLLHGARIVDIAPSVLKALSVPIPEHMDGKPLF